MGSRWSAVAVVLAVIAAHMGCVEGLEFIATSSSSASTGSQGGSGVTSNSTGSAGGSNTSTSGSGGTGGGCMTPADCPGLESLCRHKTCSNGLCGWNLEPAGTAITSAVGDCKKRECNMAGAVITLADDNDPYFDGNECTIDACDMMTMSPLNTTLPDESPCGGGTKYCCPSNFCDLAPQGMACRECHPNVQPWSCTNMATPVCQKGKCVPMHCTNMVKDTAMAEGGIDCGGPCALCADGAGCTVSADCASQVCSGTPKTCAVPTCMDNKKNGTETGIDCGGGCTSKCPDTFACIFPSDCESSVCLMNQCQMPTCMDGVKNGTEADIDCGGTCSPC